MTSYDSEIANPYSLKIYWNQHLILEFVFPKKPQYVMLTKFPTKMSILETSISIFLKFVMVWLENRCCSYKHKLLFHCITFINMKNDDILIHLVLCLYIYALVRGAWLMWHKPIDLRKWHDDISSKFGA